MAAALAGAPAGGPGARRLPDLGKVGHDVVKDVEVSVFTISQIGAAVFVLVVLVAALACLGYRVRSTLQAPGDGHKHSSMRWHLVKEQLYNWFCCGCCFHARYRQLGFDVLQADTTLRITLLQALSIQEQLDFYFEIWTEPVEGYPKNSRVHRRAVGGCDLGGEQLELDWHGDEEELVLQAVRYGAMQGKDVPLGEVKLPRAWVEKYAKEAGQQRGAADPGRGARRFSLRRLSEQERKLRMLRFKPASVQLGQFGPLLLAPMKSALEDQGLTIVSSDEKEKQERQLLAASSGTVFSSGVKEESDKSPMEVALRFEFLHPKQRCAKANLFKASSFQHS